MFYVYEYYIVETGEIIYVGKGTGRRAKELYNRNKQFLETVKQFNCKVRIYKDGLTNDEACELEIKRIAELREQGLAKCNISNGGDGALPGELNHMYGVRLTGENNPFYGRKHSDETKKKISQSRKGKGARIGKDNPMYGKEGLVGEKNPMFGKTGLLAPNKRPFKVTYPDGKSEILMFKQCEKKFGIAFLRVQKGGVLHYKKKTPNAIYEGTSIELVEPVTTMAKASTLKRVETGNLEDIV